MRKEINALKVTSDNPKISDRVKELVLYSIERCDYYENYRTKYLTLSAELLAFSVGFLSLMSSIISPVPFLILLGTSILLFMCVLNVILYLKESVYPGYVHRSVSDVPWYYLYNLKRMNSAKNRYLGKPEERRKNYLLDLYENTRKRVSETNEKGIKADIEQLTILYVITAYKVRFSDRMQRILSFGILSFGIFSGFQLILLLL